MVQENRAVVTTLDNKMHGFQSGDTVTFKEVSGMIGLNGRQSHIEGKHTHCIFTSINCNIFRHQQVWLIIYLMSQ